MARKDLIDYLRDFGWRDVLVTAPASGMPGELREATTGRNPAAGGSKNPVDALAVGSLAEMADRLSGCQRCRLHEGRTQVVFGVGDPKAKVIFIGEAPGADEDRLGAPFVGRAGQLLTSMLAAIGLRREDVYIGNVLKCRPPGNRDPQDDETAACLPFLWRQIELINPSVIVTLGRVAAHHLLGIKAPITSFRGRWSTWRNRDVLPTLHPAYLLRSPAAKALVWSDLKQLRRRLDGLAGSGAGAER